jgi:transposase InsO family protein
MRGPKTAEPNPLATELTRLQQDHAHLTQRLRRKQLRHPVYQKPELLAEGPNQVWSWDITKLMGPTKWSYFYLYVDPGLTPFAQKYLPTLQQQLKMAQSVTSKG